jgi:hypothetical protein
MSSDTEVRLVGEGGVEWTFTLPLAETYADQVAKGQLRPADEKSAAALAPLGGETEEAKEPESMVSAVAAVSTHAQANELAQTLGVEGFGEKSPPLDAKKEQLLTAAEAADAAAANA